MALIGSFRRKATTANDPAPSSDTPTHSRMLPRRLTINRLHGLRRFQTPVYEPGQLRRAGRLVGGPDNAGVGARKEAAGAILEVLHFRIQDKEVQIRLQKLHHTV